MKGKPNIEEIFSSRGSTAIIKLLAEKEEVNISAIARLTGLNYKLVNKYLKRLEEYGLIQEKRFGRIRIIVFNEKSKYASLIREFIYKWRLIERE